MKVIAPGEVEIDLGITETTPTIGIVDYSRRVTDDFGVTTVVPRAFARRMSVRFALPSSTVDQVQGVLAGLRATPAQWVAAENYAWLNFEGFFKDFSIDVVNGEKSFCTIEVEGLAEAEAIADAGEEAAPAGRASTFHLLDPVAITDAMLTATNIAEAEWPNWSAGLTYALGDRVLKTSTHRVYESAIAGNTGNDPAGLSGQWIDVGPTRRWAMFDQALGTASFRFDSIVVTLDPGAVDAVALLDVVGATVRVQTTGYDETKAVTAGTISFLDLPGVDAPITVTILGPGTVSVGTLLVGSLSTLGITGDSPTAGIIDFSRKEVDDFGEVTIVERAWSKRMSARTLISTGAVDLVANRIAAVRARPSLWIADGGTDALTIYGFFKDFSIEVGENVSTLSLSVEGLSEAAPVSTGLPPVNWPDVVDSDPAQPKPDDGATVGAPVGTPVGDRPAEQVNAEIDAALAQIDDLFETYGDTASASISAGLAADARDAAVAAAAEADGYAEVTETARDEAQGFASAAHAEAVTAGDAASASEASAAAASAFESSASSSADLSATYRDQAEGYKNTAQTQAGIATTQNAGATAAASAASASETLTATYRDAAQKAAQRTQPSTFEDGVLYFHGASSGSAPARVAPGVDPTYGPHLQTTDAALWSSVAWKKRSPSATGKRWKVRALVSHVSGTASRVELALETYNSAEGGGRQSYVGGGAIALTSSTPVWIESVITASAHPFIVPSVTLNYPAPYTSIQRVYALELIDVDALEAATAQAGIATAQAAVATTEAAAAKHSFELTASIGQGALNMNSGFDDYPSATVGQLPTGWNLSPTGVGAAYRYADPQGGWALRIPAPANTSSWIGLSYNGVRPLLRTGSFYVLEVDIILHAGSLSGAGVQFSALNTNGVRVQDIYVPLATTPDASGAAPGGGAAGRTYQFRKLVQVTGADANGFHMYVLNHWATFGSIAAANDITWLKYAVRPATPAEIRDQTVLAPLEATVAVHDNVLSTHTTQLATRVERVSAGASTAEIKFVAFNSGGTAASSIGISADRVTLGTMSSPVLSISAGRATVSADLYVQNGRIVIETATHMKVQGNGFGNASQFIEWFGPKMAINLCSEANAVTFVKTNGQAYYGGGFASGAFRSNGGTSSLSTTASALVGPFGTNGNPITVAVSWIYRTEITKTYPASVAGRNTFDADVATYGATNQGGAFYAGQTTAVRPSSTLQLERKIGSAAFAFVDQSATTVETMSFSGERPITSGDPGDATTATIIQYAAMSFTYTDTVGGTQDRTFRAAISRGFTYGSGTVTQNISIATTE